MLAWSVCGYRADYVGGGVAKQIEGNQHRGNNLKLSENLNTSEYVHSYRVEWENCKSNWRIWPCVIYDIRPEHLNVNSMDCFEVNVYTFFRTIPIEAESSNFI